jgi:hypothetical protein
VAEERWGRGNTFTFPKNVFIWHLKRKIDGVTPEMLFSIPKTVIWVSMDIHEEIFLKALQAGLAKRHNLGNPSLYLSWFHGATTDWQTDRFIVKIYSVFL